MTHKIVFIGESGGGKTSIIHRFMKKTCPPVPFVTTIGVDFATYKEDGRRRAVLWDTAGAERYQAITRHYYRSSHGLVIVYDASVGSDQDHANQIAHWYEELIKVVNLERDVPIYVLGNKIEGTQFHTGDATPPEIDRVLRKHEMTHVYVSAATGEGVDDALLGIMEDIEAVADYPLRTTIQLTPDPAQPSWCGICS